MIKSEYQSFVDLWLTAHEVSASNRVPSNNAVSAIFEALIDYDLTSIKTALSQHSRICKFAPTPHDVIKILDIGNKRMSADEAWALCPTNEDDTVIWNEDIAMAHDAAVHLLDEGDKVAARMAFKSAYNRICEKADIERRPIKWSVSLGFDKEKRNSAIRKAVTDGLISLDHANKLLPSSLVAGPIGKLLTGKVVDFNEIKEKKTKAHLKEISDSLKKPVINNE